MWSALKRNLQKEEHEQRTSLQQWRGAGDKNVRPVVKKQIKSHSNLLVFTYFLRREGMMGAKW